MTTDAYGNAWHPIPFICFGFVANGLYYFFCQPLFFAHTKHIMYISLVALAVAYGGNYFLIPYWGIIGTGVSLYASMMLTALLALYMSYKLEPQIRYHYKQMIGVSIILLLISLSVFWFQEINNIALRIVAKITLLLMLTIIIYIYYKSEIVVILNRFKK